MSAVTNIEAGHYTIDQLQRRSAAGASSQINLDHPVWSEYFAINTNHQKY